MSMIEVVAQAIENEVWRQRSLGNDFGSYNMTRGTARAAIAALRVPNEAMVWVGFDQLGDSTSPHEAEDCWKAMIDAALAEPTTGE